MGCMSFGCTSFLCLPDPICWSTIYSMTKVPIRNFILSELGFIRCGDGYDVFWYGVNQIWRKWRTGLTSATPHGMLITQTVAVIMPSRPGHSGVLMNPKLNWDQKEQGNSLGCKREERGKKCEVQSEREKQSACVSLSLYTLTLFKWSRWGSNPGPSP